MIAFTLIKWTPQTYNKISKYYDTFSWLVSPKGSHQKIIEGLNTGSILDVACGTGTLLALAQANGLKCYGLDTSEGMLDQAKTKASTAELRQGSFYEIPYPDEYFDYVVETNALGGVEIEVKKVLSEMIRVCKKGGEVRIGDFATPPRETWWHRLMIVITRLTTGDVPQNYREIFREFGYNPEVEILGWHDMYQIFRVKKDGEK
jgi:ubiquinone/menaquinone biosynthesis C-methylase UbiE